MKVYSGNEKYIFVSYAHKDSETVLPIIETMYDAGFRVWYDQGIEAGEEWPAYIEEHLTKCETVLVFMSESTVNSLNCRNEINLAVALKKNILVVYLENTILRHGLALQLGTSQSIPLHKQPSQEEFFKTLFDVRTLQICSDKESFSVPEGKTIPTVKKKETGGSSDQTEKYMERVSMFLEDGVFDKADEYCEKVLDIEPKNARAYLGKLLAERKVSNVKALSEQMTLLETSLNYKNIMRYGDDALKAELEGYNTAIKERVALNAKESRYQAAEKLRLSGMQKHSAEELIEASKRFAGLDGYKDAADKAKSCQEEALNTMYAYAQLLMGKAYNSVTYKEAEKAFLKLGNYRDSQALATRCRDTSAELHQREEAKKQEEQQQKDREKQKNQERKKAKDAYLRQYPMAKREKEITTRYQNAVAKAAKENDQKKKAFGLIVAGIIFLFIVPFVGIGLLIGGAVMINTIRKDKAEYDAAQLEYNQLRSIPPFTWGGDGSADSKSH